MKEEQKLPTTEQFEQWLKDVADTMPKTKDRMIIVGHKMWMKAAVDYYGLTEEAAQKRFEEVDKLESNRLLMSIPNVSHSVNIFLI
jgi:predicted alpha/beta hydrolase family esterase